MLHRRTHLHATPDPVVCPAQHQPRPVFGPEHDRPLTSIYTRADAVADGLLIEVPRQLAEEYRIPAPRSVAVTAQLWCAAVATAAGGRDRWCTYLRGHGRRLPLHQSGRQHRLSSPSRPGQSCTSW